MLKQWDKYVNKNKRLAAAVQVLKKIGKASYCSYIVGGSVRDAILGAPRFYDIDITTNMPMSELEKMFRTHDIGKSRDFGIVVLEEGGFDFEIAAFRQDGEYLDGRRPESVDIVGSFEEDVLRRDFTINALGLTANGEILDYVNGTNDIKNKIVRAVGDPFKRFEEDHLRMVRAARFGAMEGFVIEPKTQEAIIKMSKSIRNVTPQRIRLELVKAAEKNGKTFAKFIVLLDNLALLQNILPEVSNLKRAYHKPEYHPEGATAFDHVIKCLEISNDNYLSHLAILLHDVGKTTTMTMNNDGPGYYHHAYVGAKIVEAICDRLKFSSFQTDTFVYATKNHMKWHKILEMKPAKIARMINSPHFKALVNVCRADEFSRGEKFMYKGQFEKQLERAMEIKTKWEDRIIDNKLKLVDGEKIMALVKIEPGPLVGKIKREVEDLIINEGVDPEDQDRVNKLITETYNRAMLDCLIQR